MRRSKRKSKHNIPELSPKSNLASMETISANEIQRRIKLVTENYEGIRLTKEGVAVSELLPTWRVTLSDLPRAGEYIVEREDKSSKVRSIILQVLRVEHEPSQNINRPSNIYIVVEVMKGEIIRKK